MGVMNRTLYVFGNEHLADDSLAWDVAQYLHRTMGLVVQHLRSPDDLLLIEDPEILILDVVRGISSPLLIDDVARIKTRSLTTAHDFDLGFFLHLFHALGEEKTFKIIGVPQEGEAQHIAENIMQWIN